MAVQVEEGGPRMMVSICSCGRIGITGTEGVSLYKKTVVEDSGQCVFHSSYKTM